MPPIPGGWNYVFMSPLVSKVPVSAIHLRIGVVHAKGVAFLFIECTSPCKSQSCSQTRRALTCEYFSVLLLGNQVLTLQYGFPQP